MARLFTPRQDHHPAALLCHPAVIAAVLICALNDHVLKGSGWLPGAVTGKVSDVAGLFFFPVLVAVVLVVFIGLVARLVPLLAEIRRLTKPTIYADTAVVLTVFGFTAVNVIEPVNAFAERYWGVFTMDATDLICLPMVVVARHFMLTRWTRPEAQTANAESEPTERRGLRWPHFTALVCAAAVSIATPATPPTVSDFPHWSATNPITHCQHDVEITPWFARSGKDGAGVVLRFRNTTDEPRKVTVKRANFTVFRDQDSPDNTTLYVDAERPEPITVDDVQGIYLPFEFDNETAWNDGLHRGRVQITLRIDDRPARLRILADHRSADWSEQYTHYDTGSLPLLFNEPWGPYDDATSESPGDEDEDSDVDATQPDPPGEPPARSAERTGYHPDRKEEFLFRLPDDDEPYRVRLGEDVPGGCPGGDDD